MPRLQSATVLGLSRVKIFFHWWADTLLGMLPDRVLALVKPASPTLFCMFGGDAVRLVMAVGRDKRQLEVSADGRLSEEDLALVKAAMPEHYDIVVMLDQSLLLSRDLFLPAAVEPDLGSVLNYEIDRFTPFTREQIQFGYRISDRFPKQGKIKVSLWVIRKEALNDLLASLATLEGRLVAVYPGHRAVHHGPGMDKSMNMLPEEKMPAATSLFGQRRVKVGMTLVVLLLVAFAAGWWQTSSQLSALEQQIQIQQPKAMAVSQLRRDLFERTELENVLVVRRNGSYSALDILLELTRIMPDHTWVNRLQLNGDTLQVRGESSSAFSLIEDLDNSLLFSNVKFSSPVSTNRNTGREQYVIEMLVEPRG